MAAAGADPVLELDIVPVAVYWGRAPQREKSFLGLLFSENWAFVGPFRRLLSIVFNGRGTLIRFGEPRPIQGYAAAGPDGARGARKLLKDMRAEFRHMRVDTLGPDLSRQRAIIAQVLRTRAVRQAVRQEIRDTKRTRRDGLLVARKHALEIAANYSHTFVRIADRILSRFLTRVYDGIEVRNAEYLDRLPPACEIVYMPCHRSHVDYLLLSYVIYKRGYAVPYVAAGVNLNLPVIGRLLRKGGAFFIRRSFRGSGLYPIVFMKYVDVMMNRGHPIEFFIEGGRSRTGRLLRPRTGMLSMTVRSFLRDTRRPVAYVPVYFGYDKLLEGESYIDELMGRPKEKESVGGLFGVLPELRKPLGRVYVAFGEPLLLDAALDQVQPGWRDAVGEDARPAWFGEAVDAVAAEVMRRINAAAAVTPVNLLAVALLAAPRQAMLEADLERQLQLYIDLLKAFPYSPDVSVAGRTAPRSSARSSSWACSSGARIRSATCCGWTRRTRCSPPTTATTSCTFSPCRRWWPAPSSTMPSCATRTSSACSGACIPTCARNSTCAGARKNCRGSSTACSPRSKSWACWQRSADGVDLAALDDRERGGGAAVGARPGDRPGDRALLPRDRAAAPRRARRADARSAGAALRRDGAAHVHALRARRAGILRQGHVPRLHRPAAPAWRRTPGRRRQADL